MLIYVHILLSAVSRSFPAIAWHPASDNLIVSADHGDKSRWVWLFPVWSTVVIITEDRPKPKSAENHRRLQKAA